MGKLITLPVKKMHAKPRKWSLPAFQQRTHQSQEAIQAVCTVLINDYKLLKRKKRIDYKHYVNVLQMVHALYQRTASLSSTMYNACFHVQQHADKLIRLLKTACAAYSTTPIEEAQLYQDLVQALAVLLESGKEISTEITALLDQIRFCEQQRRIV